MIFGIKKVNQMVNIGIVFFVKKNQEKYTTTPQAEKIQTTIKHTAIKTKNILTNTLTTITIQTKNYTGNGTE